MSHFAKIEDGIVTQVIVAEQDFIDTYHSSETWVQTSYNTRNGIHYGQDGEPDGDSPLIVDGDGTVPLCSAALMEPPCESIDSTIFNNNITNGQEGIPWATLYAGKKGKHSHLMGEFKCEIHAFLRGNLSFSHGECIQ